LGHRIKDAAGDDRERRRRHFSHSHANAPRKMVRKSARQNAQTQEHGNKTNEDAMKKKPDATGESGSPARAGALSRRRFGQLAMMGLAGTALMPGELLLAKTPAGAPLGAGQNHAAPHLSAAARAEIEEKLKRIFAEYGDRLSENQKRHMRGIVSYHVQMLETIRAIPLENPDAPATVLKLARGNRGLAPGRKRSAARARARKSPRAGR
jgi:hypothetical protein